MSAQPYKAGRLGNLHDRYVWKVNAAIGAGREDLAWELADDYFDRAVEAMTDAHPDGCERPGCAMCDGPRRRQGRLRRWFRRPGT
jgi:hypothetical protein